MHRISVLLVPLLSLVGGCAHADAVPVQGPDGQPGWYAVTCKRTQANCFEMAGEVCPGGYVTADSQAQTGVAVNGAITPYSGYVGVHPTYRGDMLIKCKSGVVEVIQTTAAAPAAVALVPAPAVAVVPAPAPVIVEQVR